MKVLQDFSFKYVDIMLGVMLGLGFQWWPELTSAWQYIAFIFVYLNLIDYWIDYAPTLKKYPMRRGVDVIIHTLIMFAMFFMIFGTQRSLVFVLGSFVLFRVGDLLWLWRIRREGKINRRDSIFISTWTTADSIEIGYTLILMGIAAWVGVPALTVMVAFVILRVLSRIAASVSYRQAYFS